VQEFLDIANNLVVISLSLMCFVELGTGLTTQWAALHGGSK
jgi:hypothetical protein